MNQSLREQLLVPAVYSCLLELMEGISEKLERAIVETWPIEAKRLERLNPRSIPTRTKNLFISFECYRRFGSLEQVPGFYQIESTYNESLFLLDLDASLAKTGFVIPQLHSHYRYIERLRVYRSPRDLEGFVLTTRSEREREAA